MFLLINPLELLRQLFESSLSFLIVSLHRTVKMLPSWLKKNSLKEEPMHTVNTVHEKKREKYVFYNNLLKEV